MWKRKAEKDNGRIRHIGAVIFSVSSIILLAKVLGFLKQMYIAKVFGATGETDIVFLSQGVVTDLEYLLSQTMITAFIPIYTSLKVGNEKKEIGFTGKVITIFSLITIFISVIIFFSAPFISHFLAPGYTGDMSSGLTRYIRIYAFTLVVLLWMAILNALLKANKAFVPGEFISINQSLIFVAIVFFMQGYWGINSLVISFFAYVAINCIYLGVCARQYWSISALSVEKDENVIKLLKMMGPLLLGYALLYINQQVDRILASGLGDGAVTALSYSAVLSNFVSGFIGSISGIIFTYVATHVAEKRHESAADLINKMLTLFVSVLLPVMILTIANSKEIVAIVYGRGAFDSLAIENTSNALKGYGFVFVSYAVRELFTRLQYSYQDSKLPMINSIISIFINIVLSIILSKSYGIFGITIASSISVLCCAVFNIITSRKYNKFFSIMYFRSKIIIWLLGGIGCVSVNSALGRIISDYPVFIRFVIMCLASVAAYTVIISPIMVNVLKEYKKGKRGEL